MKRNRFIALVVATTIMFSNNAKPIDWSSYYTKTMEFVKNDIPNFATNTIPTFFTAKTNHILKPTPGIIPNSQEMLKQANGLVASQTETIKQIPKFIETLNGKSGDILDLSKEAESLEQIKHCIENYKENTGGLINYIKENGKLSLETAKKFFGLIKTTVPKTKYQIHDSISENGLTQAPNYLVELTKQQKDNFVEFEECIQNVNGHEKFLDKEWLKLFFKDKAQISEQYILAILEKLKYHTREILETVTPDNTALKWALIAGATILAAETIYALSYGVTKKDLQKGIANVMKFNWEAIKFIPWTLPKYLFVKPAKAAMQKIKGNGNGPNVLVNINAPHNGVVNPAQ